MLEWPYNLSFVNAPFHNFSCGGYLIKHGKKASTVKSCKQLLTQEYSQCKRIEKNVTDLLKTK